MAENDAPVRVCCGQRHYGVTCPDGKVMCCVCFERFDVSDLAVSGNPMVAYDVCKGCAPRVFPPAGGAS